MRHLCFATLVASTFVSSACSPADSANTPIEQVANPASVHCINAGGKLVTKRTAQGDVGMCQLPSGKLCEEWAFFRGECS